jgi:hypothetical protein
VALFFLLVFVARQLDIPWLNWVTFVVELLVLSVFVLFLLAYALSPRLRERLKERFAEEARKRTVSVKREAKVTLSDTLLTLDYVENGKASWLSRKRVALHEIWALKETADNIKVIKRNNFQTALLLPLACFPNEGDKQSLYTALEKHGAKVFRPN